MKSVTALAVVVTMYGIVRIGRVAWPRGGRVNLTLSGREDD
jgi:hypothetical protein